jgi:hypothetical protein
MATILYFNRGNPYYLKYSIAQTVEVCKGSRVVLLGDESNSKLSLCEWRPIDSYFDSAARFGSIYKHLSTNDRDFDLGCFQTWFVFDEFARKEGLQGPIVCLDHDVLLYSDIAGLFDAADFDIATTSVVGNQYTLFRSPGLLHGYTVYMEEMYTIPSRYAALEEIYRTKVCPVPLPGGWICDMTLLGMYALGFGGRRLDLSALHDGSVYDYALGEPEGFQYNPYKGIKRIRRDHKGFYGIRSGQKLYFAGLHFQVGAKVFLPQYYTGRKRFQDYLRHEYIRWRGRATSAAKWLLHRMRLYSP